GAGRGQRRQPFSPRSAAGTHHLSARDRLDCRRSTALGRRGPAAGRPAVAGRSARGHMTRLTLNLALLLTGIAPGLAGADDPAPAPATPLAAPAAVGLRPYEVVYEFSAYGFN